MAHAADRTARPRRPRAGLAVSGGAARRAVRRGMAHGADGTARLRPGRIARRGQRRTHYRGSANPRQEAGNLAKIDISDAINAYHAFGKIRKNNQLVLEA